MRISVVVEQRFQVTPDGKVWTRTQYPSSFWERYLQVFEEVNVIARAAQVPETDPSLKRVDGHGIRVSCIPHYVGPLAYLVNHASVRGACRNAVQREDAVIFRLGSILAGHVLSRLHGWDHPYAVDIVSDPHDAFAPGSIQHPLRPLFRWYLPRRMRSFCCGAAAGSYVTSNYLQQRYPLRSGVPAMAISDVELSEKHLRQEPRSFQNHQPLKLIFIGSLHQRYKGLHVLLSAMRRARRAGANFELSVIGDGKERPALERQVHQLRLTGRVKFKGELPGGDPVFAELDQADLFVMPSLTEGLPRAMIEAMARALPCVGTRVGGIPELLDPEGLVEKNDIESLSAKLVELSRDARLLTVLSHRNLQKAREFVNTITLERWKEYWTILKKITEQWLVSGKPVNQLYQAPG